MIDSGNDTERVTGSFHGMAIDAEVGLCQGDGGNRLLLRLRISLPDLPSGVADPPTGGACRGCRYSNIIDVP